MKKIFNSLIAVFASFLLVSAPSEPIQKTSALASEEVVLLYVEAPEGWESPHLWTWNEAGTSAYSILGWPGKAMIEDPANEGWFYLYVPKTMETGIISNALEGEDQAQTEGFDYLEGNMWVTIAPDGDGKLIATPSTTKATTGELPEFIDTIYVFALVPIDWDAASIWAWSHPDGTNVIPGSAWPGTAMDLQSDGWFMLEIPAAANRVIITDGAATAAQQTVDIDLVEGNNYIVVGEKGAEKFAAEAFAEKPIIIEEGLTIYVTVPAAWDAPHAWAWAHPEGTGLYPTWPGEPLTYDEEAKAWVLIVPDWVNRIIINNNVDGTVVQTGDIDIPAEGEEFELTVGEVGSDGKYSFQIVAKGGTIPGTSEPGTSEPGTSQPGTSEPGTSEPGTSDNDKKLSPWAYVGIGAGVLVVIGIVVGVVLFLKKRK